MFRVCQKFLHSAHSTGKFIQALCQPVEGEIFSPQTTEIVIRGKFNNMCSWKNDGSHKDVPHARSDGRDYKLIWFTQERKHLIVENLH